MTVTFSRLFVRFAIALLLLTFGIGAAVRSTALAQSATIRVMVDAALGEQANSYIGELRSRIPDDTGYKISFEIRTLPTAEIASGLKGSGWDMAILPTSGLAAVAPNNKSLAFEMPFLFTSTAEAIKLQEANIGKAVLGNLTLEGVTGLVYLNAGLSRVASPKPIRSIDEFAKLRVGVPTKSFEDVLTKLGTSAVQTRPENVTTSLQKGLIDSALLPVQAIGKSTIITPPKGSLPEFIVEEGLAAQVAIVATRNESWNKLPFVVRASIGDAAISATRSNDARIVADEHEQRVKLGQSDYKFVVFGSGESRLASQRWIASQPAELRPFFNQILDTVRPASYQPAPTPGPQKKGQAGTVFFATTREDTGSKRSQLRFGDGRTDILKCGTASFPSGEASLVIHGNVAAGDDACQGFIRSTVASFKHLLVFVHGFNNRFAEALATADFLRSQLGDEVAVLMWSWPSKRDGLMGQYDYDKESASGIASSMFADFLVRLGDKKSFDVPINVLAHSMGGWHTVTALSRIAPSEAKTLRQVAFAAPDVPVDEFRFNLKFAKAAAHRVSLYACEADLALSLSSHVNKHARAGTGGEREIYVSDGVDSIDVEGRWLSSNHSYVFEAGRVLADFKATVLSDSGAADRGLTKKNKDNWHYWTF